MVAALPPFCQIQVRHTFGAPGACIANSNKKGPASLKLTGPETTRGWGRTLELEAQAERHATAGLVGERLT